MFCVHFVSTRVSENYIRMFVGITVDKSTMIFFITSMEVYQLNELLLYTQSLPADVHKVGPTFALL